MFIFQLVEVCHQYNKDTTYIIKICNALFVIFHQYNIFGNKIMYRHVPKVPYGSYAPVCDSKYIHITCSTFIMHIILQRSFNTWKKQKYKFRIVSVVGYSRHTVFAYSEKCGSPW